MVHNEFQNTSMRARQCTGKVAYDVAHYAKLLLIRLTYFPCSAVTHMAIARAHLLDFELVVCC